MDSGWIALGGQDGAQARCGQRMQRRVLAQDSAKRPDRQQRLQRRIKVATGDLLVMGVDDDVGEPGGRKGAVDGVGIGRLNEVWSMGAVKPAAVRGRWSSSFSCSARQQTKARVPCGRRMQRRLAKAATGPAKPITPKRE